MLINTLRTGRRGGGGEEVKKKKKKKNKSALISACSDSQLMLLHLNVVNRFLCRRAGRRGSPIASLSPPSPLRCIQHLAPRARPARPYRDS